ncbi:NnrS family protein [Elioraea rosea]|uniref:NnrS family protein n=1 Tax=Elioraea rosea TaxID=2492390 RepID=UPI0011838249|nr:NnrS family protein [Elioraea rosea]
MNAITGVGAAGERRGFALFAHGFRPFFLMAGLVAPASVAAWLLVVAGVAVPEGPLPMLRWHAHELLGGFVAAAMIGFVMTAVPNWTGRRGYSGPPLILIATLFLAARLALLPGSPVPIGLAAPLALLPIPATVLLVLPALVQSKAPKLFLPPAIILAFWSGQVLMLGEAASWWEADTWATGQMLMANVALLLVGLIGGRIVPAFTLNALRREGMPREARPIRGLDQAAMLSLAAVVASDLAAPGSTTAGAVAAVAAALVLLRLSLWHGLATWRWPILWVLHLAYAFVPAALALKAAALLLDAGWASAWLHLQTIGALGLMILAVMTRATLGHTGRDLVAAPATVGAYLCIASAALLRCFGGLVADDRMVATAAAGALWILGFALFLAVHAPMLIGSRADGKPG